MKYKNQISVSLGLLLIVFISAFAMKPVNNKPPRNLKVLPKDISEDSLYDVMDKFNEALGVNCSFCHVMKDKDNKEDYASDSVAHKETGRDMLRMTIYLNKNYFSTERNASYIGTVTCYTCHKGKVIPEAAKSEKKN